MEIKKTSSFGDTLSLRLDLTGVKQTVSQHITMHDKELQHMVQSITDEEFSRLAETGLREIIERVLRDEITTQIRAALRDATHEEAFRHEISSVARGMVSKALRDVAGKLNV